MRCVWFADGSVLGLVCNVLSSVIFTEGKSLVFVFPVGMAVIPIPIQVFSHSNSHYWLNFCPIPICDSYGIPIPNGKRHVGIAFPWSSLIHNSNAKTKK